MPRAGAVPTGVKKAARGLSRRLQHTPVIGTALEVQRQYTADRAGSLAASITYNAFLSLFPLLLLAFSLMGFVLTDPAERARWIERIAGSIPGLKPMIGDSLDALAKDRATVGIIGLVSLAWTGANVVRAGGQALNRIFEVPEHAGLKSHLWALGTLSTLGTLGLGSVGISGAIGSLGDGKPAMLVVAFVAALVMDVVLFAVSYRLLAHGRGPPYRDLWPGSIFAAIGWAVLKAIGVWYATRTVGNATAVYGTFAATVGILVMLSLGTRVFLYGAELNAVLVERKRGANVRKAISLNRHREMRRRATN